MHIDHHHRGHDRVHDGDEVEAVDDQRRRHDHHSVEAEGYVAAAPQRRRVPGAEIVEERVYQLDGQYRRYVSHREQLVYEGVLDDDETGEQGHDGDDDQPEEVPLQRVADGVQAAEPVGQRGDARVFNCFATLSTNYVQDN